MFNWFSSNAQPKSILTSAVKHADIPKCKAEKNTVNFSSYIPGARWLTNKVGFFKSAAVNFSPAYYLSKAYNSLPTIGLTGRGFTINGFSFALDSLSKDTRKLFLYSMAFSLVTAAKAQEIMHSFYFMDPSHETHYQLDLSPSFDDVGVINDIKSICNGTFSSTAFSLNFTNVRNWPSNKNLIMPADFWRAVDEKIQSYFERCVIDVVGSFNFKHALTEEGKILGIVAGGAVVIGLAVCCYLASKNANGAVHGVQPNQNQLPPAPPQVVRVANNDNNADVDPEDVADNTELLVMQPAANLANRPS